MQNSDNNSLRAKYDNIKILNGIDTIYENRIYYDKKDRVYEIINGTINGTNSYKYAYYNNNGELCEIKENDQIERYYTYKTVNGITERKNKNETIIGLDSVGNVDTVKRNGYTYSEVLSLNSDKIYYLPDISIKRNDNEKEVYINNYKTNSLSNCNIYKRKYGRIILNEDNTSNTKLKKLVVNKKTQKDQMKYISSLTDSRDIDYLNNVDTYSVFTKYDIEKK